jgi:SAM-dependent methyltransferase
MNEDFAKEVEKAREFLRSKIPQGKDIPPNGERQYGASLKQIRRDHVARYEWVTKKLQGKKKIIDAACGCGYGTNLLAKAGHTVTGIDIDEYAIEYARENWAHDGATFEIGDISSHEFPNTDVAIAFEVIEHIKEPRPMLRALRQSSKVLFASVPNEDAYPWNETIAFHERHYTKGQLKALLNECGWQVLEWYGQEGPESEVEPNISGRTVIARCEQGAEKSKVTLEFTGKDKPPAPDHVAILGMGPSLAEYTNITKRLGGRKEYCDQTWAINANGAVYQCDLIFHMDDVRIQEIRAESSPKSNIASMVKWLKWCETPIITSRPHPNYPMAQAFPLEAVLNEFDTAYFNSTAAYAVAYAVWIGVKKISIFGCDFTYPDAHDAEKGRACVEYWLGMAAERGIRIAVPKSSSLLDACHTQRERFYGYDTVDLKISQGKDKINIEFTEREGLPTAEQIEEAYYHGYHPNPLVREK